MSHTRLGICLWASTTLAACSGSDADKPSRSAADAAARDAEAEPDSGQSCQQRPRGRHLVVIADGKPLELGLFETVNLALEGTVSAHGHGVPEVGVPSDLRDKTYDPVEQSYMQFTAADHAWTVMLRDIHGFGVTDGTAVSIEVTHVPVGYASPYRSLSVKVAGALVYYYGLFGPQEDCWNEVQCTDGTRVRSAPPGFQIRSGRKLCSSSEGCGDWTLHALELEVPGGAHVELLPDEQRSVGDFRAVGDDVWDGPLRCVDGLHGSTEVVLSRTAADPL